GDSNGRFDGPPGSISKHCPLDGQTSNNFAYSTPARASRRLRTAGSQESAQVGSVRLEADRMDGPLGYRGDQNSDHLLLSQSNQLLTSFRLTVIRIRNLHPILRSSG